MRAEPLRGTQALLPLDWLLLDAGAYAGEHRAGKLFMVLLAADRRRRHLPQRIVAGRLQVSQAMVSKWERARQEPKLSAILQYAVAAGTDPMYLRLIFSVVEAAEYTDPVVYNRLVEELKPQPA